MRRKLSRAVVCAAVTALVAAGAALAATLGVVSERLTSWSAASTVPVSTCTLTASGDSYVNQETLSQGTNYGSATSVQVESSQTLALLATNKRGFVRFNLSSCSIPAAASVRSAKLRVFLFSAPSASRTWNVSRVTGSWTEAGITWSNQPAATASTTVTTGTTSNVTLEATVTSDVSAFVSGSATDHGWRFSDATESSSTAQTGQFRSREHGTASERPTLVVTYYP